MAGGNNFVIRDPKFGSGSKTSYTGTAGTTTVDAGCQSVLVWCSSVAFVAIGRAALTTDVPVPANAPIILPIPITLVTGAPIVVSAIQDSAGGNLYCCGLLE
jgi:hypothetical protein